MTSADTTSERRRSAIIAVAALGLIVAAVVLLLTQPWSSDSPHPNASSASISLPPAFGRFEQAGDAESRAILANVKKSYTSTNDPVWSSPSTEFGIYADTQTSKRSFVVIAASGHDDGELAKYLSTRNPQTVLAHMGFVGNVIGAKTYPAAPLDGEIQCGVAVYPGANPSAPSRQLAECKWASASTVGKVHAIDFSITPADLANYTRALRQAAEH